MIEKNYRVRLLSGIPNSPGVYRFVDAKDRTLYVGKSITLRRRVTSYFGESVASPRIRGMMRQAVDIVVVPTRNEAEALLLENNLIKELKPRFNILFRDDKSYPYVRLTSHEFPRLVRHRGKTEDGGQYFGPFPNARSVRESIDLIQKVFRLRTCRDSVLANRNRPCLLHQIGRCTAPCVGMVSPGEYAQDIGRVRRFLEGRTDEIVLELEEAMEKASQKQEYERAGAIRDNIASLRDVRKKHTVDDPKDLDADYIGIAVADGGVCVNISMVRGGRGLGDRTHYPENFNGESPDEILRAFLSQHYSVMPPPALVVARTGLEVADLREACGNPAIRFLTRPRDLKRERVEQSERNAGIAVRMKSLKDMSQAEAMRSVREHIGLPGDASQIECFDVSHSFGEETVASCVVCSDGDMDTSAYRRFRIRTAPDGDDYAALAEALSRRYRRMVMEKGRYPDLVIVDGGAGQVSRAMVVFDELGLGDIPLVGISKGPERKAGAETILASTGEVLEWEPHDLGFRLLQRIRDEAHRFAVGGHRIRRDRKRHTSTLEDIEGVGPQRRRQLLARFGGIQGLREATEKELATIKGVGSELASRIYQALH